MASDELGHTAQQETLDASLPMRTNDDQIGMLLGCRIDDRLSNVAYLDGKGTDRAYGLAVDPTGNVAVTGITSSRDFPLKNPAQQKWPGGTENAFVTKFSFASQ